jgi:hypothetical protein
LSPRSLISAIVISQPCTNDSSRAGSASTVVKSNVGECWDEYSVAIVSGRNNSDCRNLVFTLDVDFSIGVLVVNDWRSNVEDLNVQDQDSLSSASIGGSVCEGEDSWASTRFGDYNSDWNVSAASVGSFDGRNLSAVLAFDLVNGVERCPVSLENWSGFVDVDCLNSRDGISRTISGSPCTVDGGWANGIGRSNAVGVSDGDLVISVTVVKGGSLTAMINIGFESASRVAVVWYFDYRLGIVVNADNLLSSGIQTALVSYFPCSCEREQVGTLVIAIS